MTADPESKTNPWTTLPDSAWAAEWAQQAMSVGRIELGYQLARLAKHAYRYEQAQADPHYRHPTPLQDDPRPPSETLLLNAPDVPPIVAGRATPAPAVTPNGRCTVRTAGGLECHGVAFYLPATDAWTHMDNDLDQLHAPIVSVGRLYTERQS